MTDDQREMVRAALQPVIQQILHVTHDDREREALFKGIPEEIKAMAATWIAEYEAGFRQGRNSVRSHGPIPAG